jgi:hypothetical protein
MLRQLTWLLFACGVVQILYGVLHHRQAFAKIWNKDFSKNLPRCTECRDAVFFVMPGLFIMICANAGIDFLNLGKVVEANHVTIFAGITSIFGVILYPRWLIVLLQVSTALLAAGFLGWLK